MTELTHIDGVPGAVVIVDPRMVRILAIDLLDEEPEPEPMALADARRFQVTTETRDEEPERQAVSPAA
jgi:hypothetical protein